MLGGRQARNFTTNAPKIVDLKSSSEQIFSRKLPLGAPEDKTCKKHIPHGKIHMKKLVEAKCVKSARMGRNVSEV